MSVEHTPIFFVNRNRLSSLKRMIDWLKQAGFHNITVIDNDSSYPPLLDYYNENDGVIKILKVGRNAGPWVFWELGLHKTIGSDYIVSDSDIYASEFCPNDLINFMHVMLRQHPTIEKVGAGLNLDNISPNYSQSQLAYQWETQFWHNPVGRCLFAAPIDTTFALYRRGVDFSNDASKNLRLGYPYLIEHAPWQVNDNDLDEEETYYRNHVEGGFSYWSAGSADERLLASDFIKNDNSKRILHLGGGNEYIPGWVNIDVSGRKLDLEFDLDSCGTHRLPFDDDSVDGFYMCHVFEHISDTLSLMSELYRIAKDGARMFIRLPHGSNNDAWEDPTHKRAYFEGSFVYFSQPAYSRADYGYVGDWQVDKVQLIVGDDLIKQGAAVAFNAVGLHRNLVAEMIVELTAVKPARPRRLDLLMNGQVVLTSTSLIGPSY